MPWKTEIDRLVHQSVLDSARSAGEESQRAVQAVLDLIGLAPARPQSHFHLGAVEELIPAQAAALPPSDGEGAHWRYLGRLDAASRRAEPARVRELMGDPGFESAIPTPEGRVALRAVGRMLLRDGEEDRAFSLYQTHLSSVDDEGSRRDAEFLLEDALRRADREEDEGGAVFAHLDRAAKFAEAARLDPRARAKVDRKLGRLHQLAAAWQEAEACYRRALDRLPPEDPYRSVLLGDLALSVLGVRGTLDLLPAAERPNASAAEDLLRSQVAAPGAPEPVEGEGRSYNAIYTLGMLAYERGEYARAAEAFREADRLMRENRAKARIVHARSRFFLGHCMLLTGAEGEALVEAERLICKDAGPSSLDPAIKDRVFDDLAARVPGVRIPGRGGPQRGRGRGRDDRRRDEREPREDRGVADVADGRDPRPDGEIPQDDGRERAREERSPREERGPRGDRPRRGERRDDRRDERRERRPSPAAVGAAASHEDRGGPPPSLGAAAFVEEARRCATTDPHHALELVDRAFKSRPDFETWFGAYSTRLEALLALGERAEAYRTYERFRAKLYQREALKELERFLLDMNGPMRRILDEAVFHEELIDLYEVMTDRADRFVEECLTCAKVHLDSGEPARIARALAILREAQPRSPESVRPLIDAASDAASRHGVGAAEDPTPEQARDRVGGREVRILLVGGDEGRRPHLARLRELSERIGFRGDWIFTGSQPPHKTLRDVEDGARGAAAIVLHHATGRELRDEIHRLGQSLRVPVREAAWLGTEGVQAEILRALRDAVGS
jgi:tetratricopeptide (TPR) repeat protein